MQFVQIAQQQKFTKKILFHFLYIFIQFVLKNCWTILWYKFPHPGALKPNSFFEYFWAFSHSKNSKFATAWKNIHIRSFFWSVFSCVGTEYGVSTYRAFSGPYFLVFGLNTDQKKLRIWTLFTQCVSCFGMRGRSSSSFYSYRTHALAFSNFYNVQRKNFENLTYYFCTLV